MTKQRFLFAAAAVAGLCAAAPALAQDQPTWTGPYAGINLGGAWSTTSNALTAVPGSGAVVIPPSDVATLTGVISDNNAGFAGGGEVGYNYQMGWVVFGLETDFGAFLLDHSRTRTYQSGLLIAPPVTASITQKVSTDWLWTVRPRLGVAFDRWMVYGTGGLAMTQAELNTAYADTFSPPNLAAVNVNGTKTGWTAGAGGAYALSRRFAVKVEWLYSDFGTITGVASTPTDFATITSSAKIKSNLVRMGVDYRF